MTSSYGGAPFLGVRYTLWHRGGVENSPFLRDVTFEWPINDINHWYNIEINLHVSQNNLHLSKSYYHILVEFYFLQTYFYQKITNSCHHKQLFNFLLASFYSANRMITEIDKNCCWFISLSRNCSENVGW